MKELLYIHDEGKFSDSLKQIPFLRSFKEEHLEDILNSSCILECEPGDEILSEGNPANRIFILLTGKLEVTKDGEHLADFSNTGDLFGELAALKDEHRSASVVATERTYCLAIDQKFLEDILPKEQNPEFYAALYGFIANIMAERLKRTSEELSRVEKELHELRSKLENEQNSGQLTEV
jgi:CRP-like cAMP-binding protein